MMHSLESEQAVTSPSPDVTVEPIAPVRITASSLHRSIKNGNLSMTRLLLSKGAALYQVDDNGQTPLHLASALGESGDGLAIMELLLVKHADPNQRDARGQTPLVNAVLDGGDKAVQILLDAPVDVNARDNAGDVALNVAVSKDSESLVC